MGWKNFATLEDVKSKGVNVPDPPPELTFNEMWNEAALFDVVANVFEAPMLFKVGWPVPPWRWVATPSFTQVGACSALIGFVVQPQRGLAERQGS